VDQDVEMEDEGDEPENGQMKSKEVERKGDMIVKRKKI